MLHWSSWESCDTVYVLLDVLLRLRFRYWNWNWYRCECKQIKCDGWTSEMRSICLTQTGVWINVCIKNRWYLRNIHRNALVLTHRLCDLSSNIFLLNFSTLSLCSFFSLSIFSTRVCSTQCRQRNTFHCQLFPIINSISLQLLFRAFRKFKLNQLNFWQQFTLLDK